MTGRRDDGQVPPLALPAQRGLMASMASNRQQWCAVLAFGVGALILQWAAEMAKRLHEAAYWPGIAVGMPIFFVGCLLLMRIAQCKQASIDDRA